LGASATGAAAAGATTGAGAAMATGGGSVGAGATGVGVFRMEVSEELMSRLRTAEEKLRELRRRLADASTPTAQRVPVDLRQAAQAFQDIEQLVQVDPAAARARLSKYLEPVVMTPAPDETGTVSYTFDITLRNETATLAGGRVQPLGECGCGDRI
jgi:hypothetical protein